MKAHSVIGLIAALVLTLTANAVNSPSHVVEDGREVAGSMITLPNGPEGTMVVQRCTACEKLNFSIGPNTRFFIGGQETTFVEFRQHITAYPTKCVTVATPKGKMTVSRISACGAPVRKQ